MREIKFRAWAKHPDEGKSAYLDQPRHMEYFTLKNTYDNSMNNWWFRDCVLEIMQYTGLKDKNGVEIYEGDIIKTDVTDGEIYKIFWNDFSASYMMEHIFSRDKGNRIDQSDEPSIEVIGNIYENPELVK